MASTQQFAEGTSDAGTSDQQWIKFLSGLPTDKEEPERARKFRAAVQEMSLAGKADELRSLYGHASKCTFDLHDSNMFAYAVELLDDTTITAMTCELRRIADRWPTGLVGPVTNRLQTNL
ncbi:hypothetical protein Poly51_35130 [Rubripirellula tenax]|uniref:Uncharacterized protein n=1 Tax=Rubripirellula tenax TaxID=2528015 RepID=A0A5C6F2F2_9BACT|nr:hypothetical protein [Rubripirellula tenax]TWU54794.1 hypothetical protein Poly51_35130 [Rubripirellula tenax]